MNTRTINPQGKTSGIVLILFLLITLIFAGAIRINAFWTSHWKGDQGHYGILAMKIDRQGMKGYNLREAQVTGTSYPDLSAKFLSFSDSLKGKKGYMIEMLTLFGQSYYDESLHMRAPLFPALLAASHKILANKNYPPYTVLTTDLNPTVSLKTKIECAKAQLWISVVPYTANLILIVLSGYLAYLVSGSKLCFGLGSLLMTFNPLSVWLAHKILTEDVATMFITVSMIFYLRSVQSDRSLGVSVVLSGVFGGCAILANQKTGLIIPVIYCYEMIRRYSVYRSTGSRWIARKKSVVNLRFFIWCCVFFAVSGWWFYMVWKEYGHPLHFPSGSSDAFVTDVTGWFMAVFQRPHSMVLFSIGVLWMSPAFIFMFWANKRPNRNSNHALELLWIWVIVFFLCFAQPWHPWSSGNEEHRYYYFVYPALSALAAIGIEKLILNSKGMIIPFRGIVVAMWMIAGFYHSYRIWTEKVFASHLLF